MNSRIKKIRKDLKLTQDEFAKRLNLSRNFVSQMEGGSRFPSDRTLSDICREFNVNYEWLTKGTGSQYRNNDDHIHAIIDNILDGEDTIAKRAFYEFSKLDPSEWETLEKLMRGIIEGNKKQ